MRHLKSYNESKIDPSILKEEEIKYISDIFLELEDSGYYIITGKSNQGWIHRLTPGDWYTTKISKPNYYFKIRDIMDEILHLKSYLGEKFIGCSVIYDGYKKYEYIDIDDIKHIALFRNGELVQDDLVSINLYYNL